jgi:hypothetical protein
MEAFVIDDDDMLVREMEREFLEKKVESHWKKIWPDKYGPGSWLKRFIFRQKFRFDMGYQFIGLFNFALLLVATSDKLKHVVGIHSTKVWVAAAVLAGFAGVWLFGYVLDRYVRYSENMSNTTALKNPHALENYERLKRIEELLTGGVE